MQRYLFGGALHGELDRQGRVALPAPLLAARAARARTSSSPACGTGSRSGTARPGVASSPRSKGAPRVLPNVLPSPSPDAHVPVLAREVGALLDVHPGEPIVDCTFGAGGHSRALARDLDGRAAGRDRPRSDARSPTSTRCARRAAPASQARPMHGPFAPCLRRLAGDGAQAGAVLMDLGMSSMQSTRPRAASATCTTRRSTCAWIPSDPVTAASLVNEWTSATSPTSSAATARSASRRRSRAPSSAPQAAPFTSTSELVETIKRAIPTPARFGQGHPARRVFQALRIAVNDELGPLADGLESALDVLRAGRPVAVISFHSLEDRMVKQSFVKAAAGCICPPDLPVCGCGRTPEFRLVHAQGWSARRRGVGRRRIRARPRPRLRVVQREVTMGVSAVRESAALAVPRFVRAVCAQRAAGPTGARRCHVRAPDRRLRGRADRHPSRSRSPCCG